MPHVLFICTANICRSPVVEGMFRDALAKRGLTGWTTASAGTWAIMKRGASTNSVEAMAERGIDISRHQAQIVTEQLLSDSDLVLCMEAGHAEALRAEFPNHTHKIFLFTEMINRRYNISDPYGGSREQYERMAKDVELVLREGFDEIIDRAQANAAARGGAG